jgi:hypothetical protein
MDFIFMPTRQDRTIADCLDLFRMIRPLGLKHAGFKDVGVSRRVLASLDEAIRASDATGDSQRGAIRADLEPVR